MMQSVLIEFGERVACSYTHALLVPANFACPSRTHAFGNTCFGSFFSLQNFLPPGVKRAHYIDY